MCVTTGNISEEEVDPDAPTLPDSDQEDVTAGNVKEEEEVDPDAPTLHDSDHESVAETIVVGECNEAEDHTNEEVKHEPKDSTGVQIGVQGSSIGRIVGCIHVVDEEPRDFDAVYGVNPDLTTPELSKDIVLTMPQRPPVDPELEALLDLELKNYGAAP